ncbi:hypothetical protein Tco_1119660 [Tanacetum coccineum]
MQNLNGCSKLEFKTFDGKSPVLDIGLHQKKYAQPCSILASRKVHYLEKMDFQKKRCQMGGKGMVGCMQQASDDAMKIAKDIGSVWKKDLNQKKRKVPSHRRCISTF